MKGPDGVNERTRQRDLGEFLFFLLRSSGKSRPGFRSGDVSEVRDHLCWKLEHYVRQYGEGRVTLARAARDAGVSLWEMIDYARARKVSAQYDLEDLKRDLGVIRGSLENRE